MTATRLVQIAHPEYGRRVGLVDGNRLHLLSSYRSVYAFASAAIETGLKLRELLSTDLSGIVLDYDQVYELRSVWRFLPSFDHPRDPARCLVSGCANPHGPAAPAHPSAPPWFYKGNGAHLRGHGEALTIPAFACSGAEEAELVGVYIIGPDGAPHRVGLTPGNEFADPALAEDDPSMLSHAKLRTCAIGPEVLLEAAFDDTRGSVRVEREGATIWLQDVETGEPHARFPLADLERNLFQYDAHRVPGDAHVHYLGGSVSSYGDGIRLQDRDQVVIEWQGFGRALRNVIERKADSSHTAARTL